MRLYIFPNNMKMHIKTHYKPLCITKHPVTNDKLGNNIVSAWLQYVPFGDVTDLLKRK